MVRAKAKGPRGHRRSGGRLGLRFGVRDPWPRFPPGRWPSGLGAEGISDFSRLELHPWSANLVQENVRKVDKCHRSGPNK